MSLSFQTSYFIAFLSVILAVGISWYFYRNTIPPVSNGRRWLLTALRSTALALLLLLIFEPKLVLQTREEKIPTIDVLVDNSLSMSQKDAGIRREDVVRSLLNGPGMTSLRDRADVHLISFDTDSKMSGADSLTFRGTGTNISAAIHERLEDQQQDLRGIILLSDGNYTAGSNPVYISERSRLPIFTIGIGDTVERMDVSVSTLRVNPIGFVETTLPVDGIVHVSRVGPASLTATLYEEGTPVESKTITVDGSAMITDNPVQFSYTPSAEGTRKISISVSAVPGEVTEKNNRRSALVKVLKNKLRVTIIAGAPGPDVSAVAGTLREEKNMETELFLLRVNGELTSLDRSGDLRASLQKADALVFIGYPSTFTPLPQLQGILRTLTERRLPNLFIGSRTIDLQKLKFLEPALPFMVKSERIDEQFVFPAVNAPFTHHPVIALHGHDAGEWQKLPPIYHSLQTYVAKPEAQRLLNLSIQGVTLSSPLMVTRSVAGTRSLAVLGYGIHRWKLLAAASDETRTFFSEWLTAVMRWMAIREEDRHLQIAPEKEFFAEGENITFAGSAFNESFQPLENGSVNIEITGVSSPAVLSAVTLDPLGAGRFTGSAGTLREGEYRYRAISSVGGAPLDTVTGRFSVGEQQLEFASTMMNRNVMMEVARRSGGRYADAERADELLAQLGAYTDLAVKERTRTSSIELWNLPFMLSLIILLFSVEWFLRKRFGML